MIESLKKLANRPAAYISRPHHGDLIILGPTHEVIEKHLKEHPPEGQEGPADLTDLYTILETYDGDLFEDGGGALTVL